ncbi:hypothetical protein OQA88_6732 [Cercophora sp. LCS_1]
MTTTATGEGLNVIALVSGGKDSFFSLLHCRANGHRVVALANLHPAPPAAARARTGAGPVPVAASAVGHDASLPSSSLPGPDRGRQDEDEQYEASQDDDLNSFMYQTVGHQVIPLYAEATGIPLCRRAIVGGAGHHGKDYAYGNGSGSGSEPGTGTGAEPDETESMVPLLREVMEAHPEANALCAGAILSTYQRTRVESVAVRLGLVPLAYLWKFPVLPAPGGVDDAQLLDDMAGAGLEARIIKVASGGLDDGFLWTNVANASGKHRLSTAMRRFGAQETGAVIGEGGEFETLVVDGPPSLFKKRVVVDERDQKVVREGGGTAWLRIENARLEEKPPSNEPETVRIPDMFDAQFSRILDTLESSPENLEPEKDNQQEWKPIGQIQPSKLQQWIFSSPSSSSSIQEETTSIMAQIRQRLQTNNLPPTAIITTTILLRTMSDFPTVNTIYGSLFSAPNPPSRVTVSCGSLLPIDIHISIHLTVHASLALSQRQGLHVQSRSYWAPANIGPYSQAISIPLSTTTSSNAKMVFIAGQIPLIPASMVLPTTSGIQTQLTLSLQHLWRVALDLNIQWFGSAVAYFPKATPMPESAILAGRVWDLAHGSPPSDEEEDEDEEGGGGGGGGPDLWDRKFDARYTTFGEERTVQTLPDWSVLRGGRRIPVLFSVEVQELPRGAAVEWHTHVGFAGVGEGCVFVREVAAREGMRVYQTCVWEGDKGVVQSVVMGEHGKETKWDEFDENVRSVLGGEAVFVVRYVDVGTETNGDGAVVPCASIWDAEGRRLDGVAVYQGVFEETTA